MPDAPSEYPRWFNYFHLTYRLARAGALARSGGRCQGCGYGTAEHAHHHALSYLPPEATTPDDLTGFCRLCHHVITLLRRFLSIGGAPGRFLAIFVAALAEAGDTVPRTGRSRHLALGRVGSHVRGRGRGRRTGSLACAHVTGVGAARRRW